MTSLLNHLWVTAPYQEDRNATLHLQRGEDAHQYYIDCHQNLGGPLTGTRTLIKHLISEAPPHCAPCITNYASAILTVAPELRSVITDVKKTLTEAASSEERLRFYPKDRGEHLAHHLVSFILDYISQINPIPNLVFDNVHAADSLDQQFLAALLRRTNPEQISIVVCTMEQTAPALLQSALTRYAQHICANPLTKEESSQIAETYQVPENWQKALLQYGIEWRGQWKAFEGRKDLLQIIEPRGTSLDECIQFLMMDCPAEIRISLSRDYIKSVCTTDNVLARWAYECVPIDIKQRLHDEQVQALTALECEAWTLGAIPYHRERGQAPMEVSIQALLLATHTCLEKGFYEKVVDLGQRGRQFADPLHYFEYYWQFTKDLGLVLAALSRVKEAEDLYKEIRALTSDPIIHLRISYAIAMHHTRFSPPNQRDHMAAVGWLQQALALVQQLPEGEEKVLEKAFHLNALALVKMHLGKKQEALSLVQEAIDQMQSGISNAQHALYRTVLLTNRGQLYAYMDQGEQALADFTEVIHLDPYYDDIYFKRAKLYYDRGQFEEACQDMKTGIAYSFPSAEIFTTCANLLRLLKRDEEALADYTHALDINPAFIDALQHRAEIYYQRGQFDLALQDYTAGITNGEPSFELFYNRAHLLDTIGHAEEALADYASALVINPTATNAVLNRAMIFYEQGAYESAQHEVSRGLLIEPNHAQLLCTCGLIESALEQNEQAYQTFTLALEHNPSLLEAWTNRAIIAYEMGLVDSAIADLTQALLLEENITILSNRAHAYQTQHRWTEAVVDYTRSLELTAGDSEELQELLYQRAQCYLKAGHTEQASTDIKAHLALGDSPYIEIIHRDFALHS